MAGIGIAKKGLGLLKKKIKSGVIYRNVKSKEMFKVMKDIKHGSKLRKGIRKLPFGKFVDFPIEVATKQKKAAALGAAVAAGESYGRHSEKRKGKK